MTDRYAALQKVLKFSQPIQKLEELLKDFSWDFDGDPQEMNINHLRAALERYISGELSAQGLEDWANLIEGREDIKYQEERVVIIEDYIYELANPELTKKISIAHAVDMVRAIDEKINFK